MAHSVLNFVLTQTRNSLVYRGVGTPNLLLQIRFCALQLRMAVQASPKVAKISYL